MEATYDFVIVGGGTAGLTLAARLSEDPTVSVAVVEAGTYYQIGNPLLSSTPLGACAFIGTSPKDTNPAVDWGIATIPQKGASDRVLHYPRGKCLGGRYILFRELHVTMILGLTAFTAPGETS